MSAKRSHKPLASIVALDPGATTGVAVLSIEPAWLAGSGDADWVGLRKAIKSSWFAQVGDDAREWRDDKARTDETPPTVPERLFNGPGVESTTANELSMIYELREILDAWPGAAWLYEDYVPESMAAAQKGALVPMRVFSTLAFGTIMDDARPRVPFVQSRSFKSTATDDRMRDAGLYLRGMPHATDAARHAAVFARRARQTLKLRQQAWPRLWPKA